MDASSGSSASRAATLAGATVLAAPLLLVLGAVLKATTHHRALGGTTFAVLGVLVGAACLAFGARAGGRVGRWAEGRGRGRSVTVASAVAVVAVLGALAAIAARSPLPAPAATGEASDHAP